MPNTTYNVGHEYLLKWRQISALTVVGSPRGTRMSARWSAIITLGVAGWKKLTAEWMWRKPKLTRTCELRRQLRTKHTFDGVRARVWWLANRECRTALMDVGRAVRSAIIVSIVRTDNGYFAVGNSVMERNYRDTTDFHAVHLQSCHNPGRRTDAVDRGCVAVQRPRWCWAREFG